MGRPVTANLHLMICPSCQRKTPHQRVGMKCSKEHLMPRTRFQCKKCQRTHYEV